MWYSTNVAVGWAPYRFGHWVWVAPWGWTWVDDAPWGFAPFHYGRWVPGWPRWAWVPGPVAVHPVYAPALVAFVGGGGGFHFSAFGGGVGVAWFPLGPGEVFVPAYRVSRAYVNQVNVTNTVVNITKVTNVYNMYTTTNINNTTVNRITYVNQASVTAVSRDTFVNSRPGGPQRSSGAAKRNRTGTDQPHERRRASPRQCDGGREADHGCSSQSHRQPPSCGAARASATARALCATAGQAPRPSRSSGESPGHAAGGSFRSTRSTERLRLQWGVQFSRRPSRKRGELNLRALRCCIPMARNASATCAATECAAQSATRMVASTSPACAAGTAQERESGARRTDEV